ncbi:MAG: RluA family pseudouridine synthase [Clostridia bacterium]|nr:RluA family pseudouridine synthase [Clostridia bacterium]
MKQITVKPNDAGQRLDKFLQKTFHALPPSMMYKAIRKKDIKRNGKRIAAEDKLQVGDVLSIYLPDDVLTQEAPVYEFMHAGKALSIVYEDEHILLLNKPVGLIVHPDDREFTDTLIFRVQRYLYEKGEYDPASESSFAPALVNRIDRNTCGIVIAAKTAAALRILNDKLKHREIEKHYLCLVYGRMPKPTDLLEAYLDKNEDQNRVYISQNSNEGRRIATQYTVLGEKDDISLLDIDLLTGRTHQIRAHLASIGHPLVGDGKYGRNEQNKRYGITKQALCSYRLIFRFTTDAEELSYLQDREFCIENVWFAQAFRKGEIRPLEKR